MFEGFAAGGQAFGGIAQTLLANNFNVNALRTNATPAAGPSRIHPTEDVPGGHRNADRPASPG